MNFCDCSNILVFISVGDKSLLFSLFTPTPLKFAHVKFDDSAREPCIVLEEKEDVGQLKDAYHQTESDTVDNLKRWNPTHHSHFVSAHGIHEI